MGKKLGYLIILIMGIGALIFIYEVVSLYFRTFAGPFSTDQSHWGTFGDYIGGVLNPFISLLNLIVTVYIARELHSLTSKESEKQIMAQTLLLKRQIQFDVLRDFSNAFNIQMDNVLLTNEKLDVKSQQRAIVKLWAIMGNFERGGGFVFEVFKDGNFYKRWTNTLSDFNKWSEETNVQDMDYPSKISSDHSLTMSELYKEILHPATGD
jgi:hypothetical protein